MSYKDPEKQKQAQRDWVRQKRADKGSTRQGSTPSGLNPEPPAYTEAKKISEQIKRHTQNVIPKRGLDIKTFEDLPPDVQRSIGAVSKDVEDKARRTARAISYQHLFPDRYESTGLN